jgi:hypothetical protein
VQVLWPETDSYIHLRVCVSAPECEIKGADQYSFWLVRGHDSPPFSFHLVPTKSGEISIIVILYLEQDTIGSTRIRTRARKQKLVGSVQINTASEPIHISGHKIAPGLIIGPPETQIGAPSPTGTSGDKQPDTTNQQHLRDLIAEKTRRLEVLEIREAREGNSTPPEVVNEMADIRAEIARLRGLLGQ